MSTWRAFIGEWDGDRTHTDASGLSWPEARDILIRFAQDEIDAQNEGGEPACQHCLSAAQTAKDALTGLPSGTAWSGEIDWDELRLMPAGES